jgi:DNA-binding response OmpR family regulator
MASLPSESTTRQAILIVEDDADIRDALQDWLHTLPQHQGSFHGQAETLLEQLEPVASGWRLRGCREANGAAVAGAVLDLNLPGMSGFELARRLRAQAPGLPVVVITAASADTQMLHGGVPPGVACLKKPFRLDELESQLFNRSAPKPG